MPRWGNQAMPVSSLKAYFRLLLMCVCIVACYPFAAVAKKLRKYILRDHIARFCCKLLLWVAGVRVEVYGKISGERPLLLVTNHVSYMDVLILASLAPVRFTPKSEIAAWPVIGGICRLMDAVFVDRRPESILEVKRALQSTLERNEVLCLFPEATTGNGIHMHPFKPSFFSLAEEKIDGEPLHVQPAAIAYRRIHRLPIDRTQWPKIAWYGDMELVPHLLQFLELSRVDVQVIFLPPAEQGTDRKAMAAACQESISKAIDIHK